jgi:hypothetical protein
MNKVFFGQLRAIELEVISNLKMINFFKADNIFLNSLIFEASF